MRFWPFKKPVLKNRVIVLCGIPASEEAFHECCGGGSDFIRSLESVYGVFSSWEALWRRYAKTAKQLKSTLRLAADMGATVVESATIEDFRGVNSFDVVIVIAHHSDSSDEIELKGRLVPSRLIVEAFPLDMNAEIDLTTCYSSSLLTRIKVRIPQSTIIGIDGASVLAFRLLLLEEILSLLCQTMDYKAAFIQAIRRFQDVADKCRIDGNPVEQVRLGGAKPSSTVCAPKEVRRGDDFIVSVFIHKPENSSMVELVARTIDGSATLRNTTALRMAVKSGDWVDFQLSCAGSNDGHDFVIDDEDKKSVVWDNDTAHVEFWVAVDPNCGKSAFVGRLKVAVNKVPAGEMLFKTVVVPQDVETCGDGFAEFSFVPYDRNREQEQTEAELSRKLGEQLAALTSECDGFEEGDERRAKLLRDIEICRKCIELVKESAPDSCSRVLKVFVSSTSDLVEYRNVIRQQIESCEMFPVMYECWGQGDDYPRDKCCRHVLDSDIFVCIIGARYGFVEPAWGMSMTEIEFRVAMKAGKPILVYIYGPYREEMQKLLPENPELVERQERLIDELKASRMVSFFSNEANLALVSSNELLTAKHERSFRERAYQR